MWIGVLLTEGWLDVQWMVWRGGWCIENGFMDGGVNGCLENRFTDG